LVSVLIALLITVLAFPEVIFLHGSLSSIGLNDAVNRRIQPPVVSVYPDLEGRDPGEGQNDIGARLWQFEPATKFMNRVIHEGESPEWNPYSATGSLGPETLADMKMAPFVLLVALLGGGSAAFSAVILVFVVAALYCLQQFCIRTLNLSRTAAVAACVMFLLCGWAASTLTSQTSGPYLLFPVVLYAFAEYQRVGGWLRLVASVAAHAALFLTTFLPGILLVLILVHSVALLLDVGRANDDGARPRWQQAGRLAGRQAGVPVLAFLATAFVWLPNLEALLHKGSEFDGYGNADLPTKPALLYLNVLTPRHIFRWYDPDLVIPGVKPPYWTTYVGIAASIFVVSALPRAHGTVRRVLVLSTALTVFALAMHLGTPLISSISVIPPLTPVGWTYWASLAGAAMTLAVACAVHTAVRDGLSTRVAVGASAVVVACLTIAMITNGELSRVVVLSLAFIALVLVVAVVLAWLSSRRPDRRWLVAGFCVGLVALELFSYRNNQRYERYDFEDRPPSYVTFLRDNLGDGRVYSAGRGTLFGEWGSALQIPTIETVNLMQQPWYRDFFLSQVNTGERQQRFLQDGVTDSRFTAKPEALDLLGVRFLVVDKGRKQLNEEIAAQYPLVFDDRAARVFVYENPDAFPRAFVTPGLRTSPAPDDPSDAPWQTSVAFTDDMTLLADASDAGVPRDPIPGAAELNSAEITDDHNTRVVVDVEAGAPGVLVLSDDYHSNWSVTVNGEPQHLGRVDDIARGVVVPAGRSTVVFEYHSTARTIGLVISLVTTAGLLLDGVIVAVRRRRSPADRRSRVAA
jgi:hypothetical protein